jgi:ParB-like chromosome segregation protein Spo0J
VDLERDQPRRKRLGNVEGLARSIEEVGLLHAIVIDQNFNLVAGRRRLEALRLLIAKGADGYKQVPVRQVNLDDLLGAEHDENVHRLDYAPSEAVATAEALEARLKEQARARQMSGLRQGQESPVPPSWRDGESGETRERLAACVGMGRTNLGKARAVVEAARRDPERYGDLVERMDETRLVDPAYNELMKRAEQAVGERQQALTSSQPGPDDPSHDLDVYVDTRVCSAEELMASLDHCVDAIVTEPPYRDDRAKAQQLYADLGRLSKAALKPVGVLAVLSRDQDLAVLLAAVTPHIPYLTTIPILTAAGGKAFTWRPVVVFGAEWGRITPAMTIRLETANDPAEINGMVGIADLIELITKPLQLVADPFMDDSTGIVKVGHTLFHPVTEACLHLDRSYVAADPDGLFQVWVSTIDFDRLREMVEELRAAEPGRRHFIMDEYGKVENVIPEPSTYPEWLGPIKSYRTRQRADRIIRLVEMWLHGKRMFFGKGPGPRMSIGKGPGPPQFVKISRDDWVLLDDVLDMVSRPLDEAELQELLHADDETPNGPVDEAATGVDPADTNIE